MVQGEDQFNNILSRVKSKAPCSVVIENEELSHRAFVDSLISFSLEALQKVNIFPVRVDCSNFHDSLSIWKGISDVIKQAVPSVYSGDDLTKDYFSIISDTNDTDDVQSYLIAILDNLKESSGWNLMLILEHFDSAIELMPEYDIMKIREMTETLSVVTITREPLEVLCERKYQSIYFANQFLEPSII